MILLDTNVLSELIRTHPSPGVIRWLDAQADTDLHISVISNRRATFSRALATRNVRDFCFLLDPKLQNPWNKANG
jgi:hypothetical protein